MADKPSDDRAAFGVFPQLQRNRSRQDREAAKNVPVDLARGFVAGVAGAPGDIESFLRIPYDYLRAPTMSELVTGDKTSKTYLPTSEDIEKRLPFKSNTPVSKAATGLGTLGGGFYFGPGSPLKVIGALPGAVRHGAKEFAKASYAGAPNVVKREGGNWIENTIDNSIRGLKQGIVEENAARRLMGDEFVNERMGDPATNAMNKWVESKIGRYVKSEMGTPSDPIRLMIEKREAEIADKFLKDQARANRMADRAAEEVDPRRKANLTRQAQRMLDDAVAQRDLAMEHTSHLPRGFQNVEANPAGDDILESVRRGEGFPEKGMGTTPSSRAWENKADMSIYPINVGEIQSYPAKKLSRQQAIEDYNAYEKTLDKDVVDYLKGKGFEDKHMAGLMKLSGEEKAQIVGDTNLKELLDAIPPYSPKEPIYELAGKESYISKLDPKSSVYSGDISGLHFDHIIDVLKQDLAARRITPEQLNRITMEQAVRRTADYDLERSVAMREAKIKQQEGFPIYKEYPEEGYKWVELAPPKELPAGYRVIQSEMGEGFKVLDAAGNEAVATASRPTNNMGHTNIPFHKTEEEAIADALKYDKRLEEALKYEGDTMGHCVGGYCPDVASGRSRIYSLRDSKGEPHVTVEVRPTKGQSKYQTDWFAKQPEEVQNKITEQALAQHALMAGNRTPQEDRFTWGQAFSNAIMNNMGELPNEIIQIKGKQNLRPIEKYDPYTQDFVKSGNWSNVGDLKNTGLFTPQQIMGETTIKVLGQEGVELPKYMTKAEADDYILQAYKTVAKQTNTNITPPEGMKAGGKVSISKNPDTMMLEVNNRKMAKGGKVVKELLGALKKPDVPPMGINVRTDSKLDLPYADLIVDGQKLYESRKTDSLRPYVNQSMSIVRTGNAPAKAIGSVDIGEPLIVDAKTFREMQDKHLVPEGSMFDIEAEGQKYLYPLTNPRRFEQELDVGRGIKARKVIVPAPDIKKAEGGYIKKPAAYINGDEFVNAAKKYGIKDSMNNLNKIVDLVNKGLSVDDAARQVADSGMHKAAGGAINADDLILEERPL